MRSQTVLNFAIFICLLVIGYTVSSRFYRADDLPVTEVMDNETRVLQPLNNGQRSILLAGVDSLDNLKPALNSLWLVSYLPGDGTLHMLPIYPTAKVAGTDFEDRLVRSFGLEQKQHKLVLDGDFVRFLERNNYWWSGYIIYDQVAQEQMINQIGNVEMDGEMISGLQVEQKLSTPAGEPGAAYQAQLAGFQAACAKLPELLQNNGWQELISITPAHIHTDLDIQGSIAEWMSSSPDQEGSNCLFPSLEIALGNH